jgi:hypothetical protein
VNGQPSPWLDTTRWPLLGVPICVSDAVDVKGEKRRDMRYTNLLLQVSSLPPMCFNDYLHHHSSFLFGTSGYDSSCGQVDRCYKEAEHDALIVKVLKGSGAIPFLKSNIDVIGKENFIWGRYDTTLSYIYIKLS